MWQLAMGQLHVCNVTPCSNLLLVKLAVSVPLVRKVCIHTGSGSNTQDFFFRVTTWLVEGRKATQKKMVGGW